MARTIETIQQEIIAALRDQFPNLSTSKFAEWRLWTYVIAAAIHAFEVLLDLFRQEVDGITSKMTSGTVPWFKEMCFRFQNGHKLVYDPEQAVFHYATDDPASRIVKAAAITEGEKLLAIRVAKTDAAGKLVPLTESERMNLEDYFNTIHTAGIPTTVISTTADTIRYHLDVYYDPVVPASIVRESVLQALEAFKTSLSYDARFYAQRMVDAVMAVESVVTVKPVRIEHKRSIDGTFTPVDVMVGLDAGYFEYADGNTLNLLSTKSL